jgi:hypothetical protein
VLRRADWTASDAAVRMTTPGVWRRRRRRAQPPRLHRDGRRGATSEQPACARVSQPHALQHGDGRGGASSVCAACVLRSPLSTGRLGGDGGGWLLAGGRDEFDVDGSTAGGRVCARGGMVGGGGGSGAVVPGEGFESSSTSPSHGAPRTVSAYMLQPSCARASITCAVGSSRRCHLRV